MREKDESKFLEGCAALFLPFFLFPQGKKMPRYVEYLGQVLPYATMGLLVQLIFA